MFGLNKLQQLVSQNVHLIPRDLIQKIITETDEFMASARRPDDLCMVSAEFE
jgi:serine phosphatase RsbU (regulator of sigma subunit)